MMNATYDKETGLFTVNSGYTIKLTADDIAQLMELANKEVFYREDIKNELETRAQVDMDEIPWDILSESEEFVTDCVEKYADMREEAQYSWEDCVNMAIDSVCINKSFVDYLDFDGEKYSVRTEVEDKEL